MKLKKGDEIHRRIQIDFFTELGLTNEDLDPLLKAIERAEQTGDASEMDAYIERSYDDLLQWNICRPCGDIHCPYKNTCEIQMEITPDFGSIVKEVIKEIFSQYIDKCIEEFDIDMNTRTVIVPKIEIDTVMMAGYIGMKGIQKETNGQITGKNLISAGASFITALFCKYRWRTSHMLFSALIIKTIDKIIKERNLDQKIIEKINIRSKLGDRRTL